METEKKQRRSSNLKRTYKETTAANTPAPQTPMKRVKITKDQQSKTYLTLTEKSYAYLNHKEDKTLSSISKTLKRDPRTIGNFLDNASRKMTFEPNHGAKGRYRKGSTKLKARKKALLTQSVKEESIHSVREAWIRMNGIRRFPRVSYNVISKFYKTIGTFVVPKLKSVVSAANVEKRMKYCKNYQKFNWKRVFFSDESAFQLNGNRIKTFSLKGRRLGLLQSTILILRS